MVGFDPQSHAAAQRVTRAQHNAQAQAAAAREILLRGSDEVPSVGLGVGMRNAQRGRRHFASADKRDERWNIGERVGAQRQPFGLQRGEQHLFTVTRAEFLRTR